MGSKRQGYWQNVRWEENQRGQQVIKYESVGSVCESMFRSESARKQGSDVAVMSATPRLGQVMST